MSGTFKIQQVEAFADRLVVRCVRDFFYQDGFMLDDVWILEVEHPDEDKSPVLRAMIGKSCYLDESVERNELVIFPEDGDERCAVRGKRVGKKVEKRGPEDLEDVIAQLLREARQGEANYHALSKKVSGVREFVTHTIDNLQRRAEFAKQREPDKTHGLTREIEDLRAILGKLGD